MRTGKSARRVALRSLAWTLAPAALLASIACSSNGSKNNDVAPPAEDGAAQDATASDASSGSAADAADPSIHGDPQDLDPSNGDPSLDIAGSAIYFDGGQPWVRVLFHGSWPPATTLYSWSCQVFLSTANAPVVTYTAQYLSGTQTDYADGIAKAKVTFAAEANGFRVLFADTTLAFDRYALQCTAQKAQTSTLAQDDSGSFTVDIKQQRTFGP